MKLYGCPFSVYVRTVRLCLEEKGLDYELVPVDPFDPAGLPDWYGDLHPFGKIPAFEDGDVRLYESDAIQRYLEARYPEPPLLPTEPGALARAVQAMRIMDSYAYPAMVWTIFVSEARDVETGWMPRDKALDVSRKVLAELERWLGDGPYLAGAALTLADTHFLPALDLFCLTAVGREMMDAHPRVRDWCERLRARPSAIATTFHPS
ncbi:glutathione S-transferase family protein [Thalassobaculum sp. OXR-137]|uniref:glutathione S-transferase family protein n=1 Tax=Thalassobaculum sp. OXR-137 TaxID=3100173 RepID=UPI002AC9BB84|nr:glutathione S-transferase family protein [Thalassobaculum sp. OXR-137]WPZ33758.1 glutathione S-transferase family protein [Thalassobaculum sp. OXR-137]